MRVITLLFGTFEVSQGSSGSAEPGRAWGAGPSVGEGAGECFL